MRVSMRGLCVRAYVLTTRRCRGNAKARAERLFAVKGKDPSEYPSSIVAKGAQAKNASSLASSTEELVPHEAELPRGRTRTLWLERVVSFLGDILRSVLYLTKTRLERRETLSHAELEADQEAEEADAHGLLDTETGKIRDEDEYDGDDPLAKLGKRAKRHIAVGPDGEPIPYWLFQVSCGSPRWQALRTDWRWLAASRTEQAVRLRDLWRHALGPQELRVAL
jgi:hypothetical protein